MTKRKKPVYPKRDWSEADKDFLRQHYDSMAMPELMQALTRTDEAIHAMASRMELTGNRYGINNYLAGKSYKSEGRKVTPQKKTKQEQPKPVTVIVRGRKKKPKRRRWCDQKLQTKPFTSEGKKQVRVDHRTVIYVPANATEKEIENIINRYKKST